MMVLIEETRGLGRNIPQMQIFSPGEVRDVTKEQWEALKMVGGFAKVQKGDEPKAFESKEKTEGKKKAKEKSKKED